MRDKYVDMHQLDNSDLLLKRQTAQTFTLEFPSTDTLEIIRCGA